MHTQTGEVRQHKPVVYQEVEGIKQPVAGAYAILRKNQVGFQVAQYDTSTPLVIDPILAYSTYLGGSGFDEGNGIAVDSLGNAYATGSTVSTNFPTSNPLQASNGGGFDAFVTKLNTAGSALVYSTYLGGNSDFDQGFGIAVDSLGNAYATGFTASTNFPTSSNPFQGSNGGSGDAFVTKLNAAGSALVYSTYLGGSDFDKGFGIAVDSLGNAYVTGFTLSTNFPTSSNPFQANNGGAADAFVTKLNAAGSALYSTSLGGNSDGNRLRHCR